MSTAPPDLKDAASPDLPKGPVIDPKVRGETLYDQVTSGLMAVVAGAFLVFAWLSMVWATQQAYAERVTAPVEIIEVSGGGGGSPEGEAGSTEKVDLAGADAADRASNNDVEAGDFEEPQVAMTPEATIDAVASLDSAEGDMNEVDLDVPVSGGGAVASGKRASKLGKGPPGLGNGPGDGGVRPEDRWSILYPPGQTLEQYARQLDALRVELGTTAGNRLQIASNFSSATPSRRIANSAGEKRLYFMWQGGSRKGNDVELLRKAGIEVGDAPIFQFYPKEIEDTLRQLEYRYRGRTPGEIRFTRFTVVPIGAKVGFKVVAQEALR